MPAGRGRRRLIPSETASTKAQALFRIMAARAKRSRSALFPPTGSACTTCMAMSGNGARIAGTTAIKERPPVAQLPPGRPEIAVAGRFAAVRGLRSGVSPRGVAQLEHFRPPGQRIGFRVARTLTLILSSLPLSFLLSWGSGGAAPWRFFLRPSMDNARRTGAALEAHFQFLLWLIPAVARFPRSQKLLLTDRIQTAALDVFDSAWKPPIRGREESISPARSRARQPAAISSTRFRTYEAASAAAGRCSPAGSR